MEDRCPTDDELRNAKSYVKYMDCVTREDHLRSIDELLAKVPNEFQSAVRLLEAAEDFIMTAASGVVERVTARLDADWELINAVDVGLAPARFSSTQLPAPTPPPPHTQPSQRSNVGGVHALLSCPWSLPIGKACCG